MSTCEKYAKELQEKRERLIEVREQAFAYERNCISITSEQRVHMHELFAENKQLRNDINWLETELALQQYRGSSVDVVSV